MLGSMEGRSTCYRVPAFFSCILHVLPQCIPAFSAPAFYTYSVPHSRIPALPHFINTRTILSYPILSLTCLRKDSLRISAALWINPRVWYLPLSVPIFRKQWKLRNVNTSRSWCWVSVSVNVRYVSKQVGLRLFEPKLDCNKYGPYQLHEERSIIYIFLYNDIIYHYFSAILSLLVAELTRLT